MGLVLDLFQRAYRTSPKNLPPGAALIFQDRGKVGKPTAALYRNWASNSEWVGAAVKLRRTQVSQAEWDIVPADPKGPDIDKGLQAEIRARFERPNDAVTSFRSWVEPIVDDVVVLDAGVIEKERTVGGDIYALHGVNGAHIYVNALWDGNPEEPRYYYRPVPTKETPFKNRDMLYIMANPTTYRVVGHSDLETLKTAIEADLAAALYNIRQVQNAAPDGIFNLGEGVRPEQVESFKSYFLSEVAGKGVLAFLGGSKNPSFIPFRSSNREMQFLEWQIYQVRKICAVMGMSPQDLGVTFDINRATGEVQQDLTEDRGLRPLLALVQDYFTREIVWDDSYGGPDNNLAFRFVRLNIKESQSKANINKLALAGMPWKTINQALIDDGRPPIGDISDPENPFNKLMANTAQGLVTLEDIPTAAELAGLNQQPAGQNDQSPGGSPPPKTPAASDNKGQTKE